LDTDLPHTAVGVLKTEFTFGVTAIEVKDHRAARHGEVEAGRSEADYEGKDKTDSR
jgi:hypothetical protein